jgi:hypothetical protein
MCCNLVGTNVEVVTCMTMVLNKEGRQRINTLNYDYGMILLMGAIDSQNVNYMTEQRMTNFLSCTMFGGHLTTRTK